MTHSEAVGKEIDAWWFTTSDHRSLYGSLPPARVGEVQEWDGDLLLGHQGLHASRAALDAFLLGHGTVACRVRLSGEVAEQDRQLCASRREVLWIADAADAIAAIVRGLVDRRLQAIGRAPGDNRRECRDDLRAWVIDAEERLRDLAWKCDRGAASPGELDELTGQVSAHRLAARSLDAQIACNEEQWAEVRAALDDVPELRDEFEREISALPPGHEASTVAAPVEPPKREGIDADALHAELASVPWIARAALGTWWRGGDEEPVTAIFVDQADHRRRFLRLRARAVAVARCLRELPSVLVVLDRAHAPRAFHIRGQGLGARIARIEIAPQQLEEHQVLFERAPLVPVAVESEDGEVHHFEVEAGAYDGDLGSVRVPNAIWRGIDHDYIIEFLNVPGLQPCALRIDGRTIAAVTVPDHLLGVDWLRGRAAQLGARPFSVISLPSRKVLSDDRHVYRSGTTSEGLPLWRVHWVNTVSGVVKEGLDRRRRLRQDREIQWNAEHARQTLAERRPHYRIPSRFEVALARALEKHPSIDGVWQGRWVDLNGQSWPALLICRNSDDIKATNRVLRTYLEVEGKAHTETEVVLLYSGDIASGVLMLRRGESWIRRVVPDGSLQREQIVYSRLA